MGAYLELIRQNDQTQKQETDLRLNMMQAAETDPDSLARAKKSADMLGLPLQAVTERLPDVEKQAFVEGFGYKDLIKNAPKTAEWLASDGLNAGVAKDDVENLSLMESILARAEAYPRALAASPFRFNAALWGLPRAGADLLSTLITGPLSQIGVLPEDIGAKMAAAAARKQQSASEFTNTVRGDQTQFGPRERALMGGIESAGQTLLAAPASIVTGNPSFLLGALTASTGGEAYGQARDKGIPTAQALTFAGSQAAIEYATEKIPVGVLFKDLGLKSSLLKTLTNQLITEMPQEQVATVLQDLNEWAVLNPDQPFSAYIAARPEAALQTAIATAVGTSVQTAATVAVDTAVNGPRHKQNEQLFRAIADTATNSKLRERLPQKFQELAAKYAGAQNVFVNAEQFQQYFQSVGIDPVAVSAELGVKNYAEALAAGTDVVIPMADFASKLAPTQHLDGLMPDLKLAQGELSAREFEAWQADNQADEQIDTGTETDTAAPARQQIMDDIMGQLVGRFDRSTAEAYAMQYTAGISTLAERMGLDPLELHQRYGLSITSPLPEILTRTPNIDTMIDPMLDALRTGKVPTAEEVNGASLTAFLRGLGGIQDEGGELAARDAKQQVRGLVRDTGMSLDRAREAAAEAGYISEDTTVADFIDALDSELRGNPVYSMRNQDAALGEQQAALNELGDWLDRMGVDLNAVDNAAVKALISGAQGAVDDAQGFEQGGTAQTETPEFKAWFGDSKVVDAEGKPLVVYHGGPKFDTFRVPESGDKGIYFTDNEYFAQDVFALQTELAARNENGGFYDDVPEEMLDSGEWDSKYFKYAEVKPVYLKMLNPKIVDSLDAKAIPQLYEEGYDGVIVKSTGDFGYKGAQYVVFEPTQIKSAIGNRGTFDPNDANILNQGAVQPDTPAFRNWFKKSKVVDENGKPAVMYHGTNAEFDVFDYTKIGAQGAVDDAQGFQQADVDTRMMAVHNLSADNLIFADKMGGLSVPSIGVVTENAGAVDGFGEITLIGRKQVADPAQERVFSSDAYTARFPKPEWPKAKSKDAQNVINEIRDIAAEFDHRVTVDETWDNMVNTPDANAVIDLWMRSNPIRAMFLRERGIDAQPIMRNVSQRTPVPANRLAELKPLYDAIDINKGGDVIDSPEWKALADAYAKIIKEKYKEQGKREGLAEKLAQFTYVNYNGLESDFKNAGKQEVDPWATSNALSQQIDSLAVEFKQWVEDKVLPNFGEPFIRVAGKKAPYTLDNIVKVMADPKVKGKEKTMTYGTGQVRAESSIEFSDIEQMREHAKKQIVNPDDYEAARENTEKMLEAYRSAVVEFTTLTNWRGDPDTWAALDASMRALAKWSTGKKRTADSLRSALRAEDFNAAAIPDDVIQMGMDAGEALMNTPVPYFEAKPQRAVTLDEFAGAVIPENAPQQVRDILEKNGITYTEYTDGNRTEAARSLAAQLSEQGADTLFQPAQDENRGFIKIGADRKMSISLLEKADLSTFLHETGHLWLEIFTDLYTDLTSRDSASLSAQQQQIIGDFEASLKWMGVPGETDADRAKAWRGMNLDQKRDYHEKWARGNEAYLMEGNAPSTALRRVFAKFRAWLNLIYRTISRLNVNLNPEIRAVFDRIYASDAEIQAAQDDAGLSPLFMDATSAGMTDAEFEAYRSTIETASTKAQDELRADMMREYQREQAKWWKERRAVVREEVAAEVSRQPVYVAFKELTGGDNKLAKADLVRRYGSEYLKRLPRTFQRVYSAEGGMNIDMAAEVYGFKSGDELVTALVNMRPMKELVEAETDARMREEYGDMRFDGSMADKAEAALHNDLRADVLMAELRALRRKQREVAPFVRAERERQAGERRAARDAAASVPPVEYFRNVARGMVSQQAIVELQPNRYLMAERKASRRAFQAMAKGDINLAAQEKQRELLNHYLYLEATKARETADKIAEYAAGLEKKSVQERVGKGGEEYLTAMNELLAGYEFRRVTNKQINLRESMRAAMARAEAEGEVIDVLTDENGNVIDPVLAQVRNYRELTIDELEAVRDMLKNIVHVATEKNKFRAAEVAATFDELAAAGIAEIEAGTKDRAKPRRSLRTPWQDKKRFIAGIPQSWRGLYSYIAKATGYSEIAKGLNNTTLMKYTVQVLSKSAAREAVMLSEAAQKLDEIFDRYKTTYLYGKGKRITGDIELNKQEQIMIAASYGTETGRQRLLDNGFDGNGFTQEEINDIINSLDEIDWQVVQDIWKLFDPYWKLIADKTQRVTGVRPEKVEALPFDTPFGMMSGGYSPIAYETMLDNRAAAQDSAQIAKEMQQAAYTRSTTRRGFLNKRVERLEGKAVRYDFGVIYKHMNEVIHDLTHHEALRDVQKLLNHKVDGRSIIDEITVRLGDGVRDEVRKTLEDIAIGDLRQMTNTERFMERLAKGSSIAGLAYNVWSAVQNFTGIANSMAVIGPKAVFSGAYEWIGTPSRMLAVIDDVYMRSEFMRTRYLNMNRDIAAFKGKLEQRTGQQAVDTAYQAYRDGGFWMMVRVQQIVDIPTWLGAYRAALRAEPGISEAEAVALADQAVVNAQGGGRTVDMSQFMRGKGWARVWTVYAGYFNVTYQRVVESFERAGVEGYTPQAIGRMVTDSLFLMAAPAILTTILREAINQMVGGDEGDDDELMLKYLKEQVSFILAMFPFLRETAAGFLGYGNYSGPVGTRFFKEVNDLGRQIMQGEVDENLVKEAVGVAGFGVGLPTSQIVKTYEGFEAYADGSGTPLAPVFGPPRE